MTKLMKLFWKDEHGAVTVDWVVLTAAVVGLCAAVMVSLVTATDNVGDGTGGYLANRTVGE